LDERCAPEVETKNWSKPRERQSLKVPAWLALIAITLATHTSVALGQNADDTCARPEFLAFDHALKAALLRNDAKALAGLIHFPLRVGLRDAPIYLTDEKAIVFGMADSFPSNVRQVVLKQNPVSCTLESIVYGSGEVWANRDLLGGYKIVSVNAGSGDQIGASDRYRLRFLCDASEYRIAIDAGAKNQNRYRAWKRTQFPSEKPTLELESRDVELVRMARGTGCDHTDWTFRHGKDRIKVARFECPYSHATDDEIGPYDADTMAANGHGTVEIFRNGDRRFSWTCK